MERHISALTTVDVALADVRAALVADPAVAFSTAVDPGNPGGPFLTELMVEVRGVDTHQDVLVELGPAESAESGEQGDPTTWAIRWRPVLSAHLLPVFEGTLTARSTATGSELELAGTYRPPMGTVGRFGDGLIGHRIARAAISTFLTDIGRRIEVRLLIDSARANRAR